MRKYALIGFLTLVSGGFMMAAGYMVNSAGWGTAGRLALPSWPAIAVAFALMRRNADSRRSARTQAWRPRLLLEIEVFVLTMAAGWSMLLAGYAAATWSWLLVPPALLLAGGAITAAYVLVAPEGVSDPSPRADRMGAGI